MGEIILKEIEPETFESDYKFQSPQWGSNSKEKAVLISQVGICFSPRNGEVILKMTLQIVSVEDICFSPRNGEVILKFHIFLDRHFL